MLPLVFDKVTKTFPSSAGDVKVLENVSFTVHEGESIAIIGKSGSGKSTLLHLAGGLDRPTYGAVYCCGQNLNMLDDKDLSYIRNKKIGFIFQSNLLLEDFTAVENVQVPSLIASNMDMTKLSTKLLNDIGLGDRIHHFPRQLSGGEKQRVAICRALINNPDIIIADEPTGALDEDTSFQVENLLMAMVRERNKSMLLVTHNEEFAFQCDHVYQIKGHGLIQVK